jgi:hypothetical protein
VNISRDELADIYGGLVVPVLHEMFESESEVAEESELATAASPATVAESRSSIERDIVKAFGSFGLTVEALRTIEGPQSFGSGRRQHQGSKLHRWRTEPKTSRWGLPWIGHR